MRMRKGVKFVLAPGARIPIWIRTQDRHIKVETIKLGEKCVRVLSVRSGSVEFIPFGISLRMPSSSRHLVAFYWHNVIQVRDAKNALIKRNHNFCEKCHSLRGQCTSRTALKPMMECPDCGHTWRLEN